MEKTKQPALYGETPTYTVEQISSRPETFQSNFYPEHLRFKPNQDFSDEAKAEKEIVEHRVDIWTPKLPASLDGYRIALLADLHTNGKKSDLLSKIVEKINNQNPNMVVFVGDAIGKSAKVPFASNYTQMLGFERGIGDIVSNLNNLEAPDGKYAVYGNHDEAHTRLEFRLNPDKLQRVKNTFDKAGFVDLENKVVEIIPDRQSPGDSFLLHGIPDEWKSLNNPESQPEWEKISASKRPEKLSIELSHSPRVLAKYANEQGYPHADIILSGHTHGRRGDGIGFEKWRKAILFAQASGVQLKSSPWMGNRKRVYDTQTMEDGLYDFLGTQLYVSAGIENRPGVPTYDIVVLHSGKTPIAVMDEFRETLDPDKKSEILAKLQERRRMMKIGRKAIELLRWQDNPYPTPPNPAKIEQKQEEEKERIPK